MEEFPQNQETNVGENTGTETLAQMPAFEEHMSEMNKSEAVGEKYFRQAEAERDRWIEKAQGKLREAQEMTPVGITILTNPNAVNNGEEPLWRPIDTDNESDMESFDEYKSNAIDRAKEEIEKDQHADLGELAKSFQNQEIIAGIEAKLENNEDFTDEERAFLGDAPVAMSDFFDVYRFLTPATCYVLHHSIMSVPRYRDIMENSDGPIYVDPEWKTVARAQMQEIAEQNGAILQGDESE